ncbi:restriction endonuclease subunit S [Nocardioides ferulae]|uniref:restriction endonuclease subunit S n=1 Tax=Nocardioides ferulae TaxID=2340821 RepID=UPI000EB40FA7|nr:restriction endonuclease subunit S [Nocardioides ferulae]
MTWREQRVQEMADLINGHPFDSADFTHDGELPLVRIRDILGSSFETFVSRDVVPESALVRDGDVVIGMDGDFNVVYWTRGEAALNQRLCLLRANGRADMRFVAYALPTHLKVINDLTYATTVKHLSSGQVRAVRMLAPAPAEQRAIADYLDRETARIDILIEEQQRLVEMLRERRVATITDALDGYDTVPLRRLVDRQRPMTYGILQAGEPVEGGVPYIGPSDITGEGTSPERDALRTTSAEIARVYHRSVLGGGDIVVSIGPAYGKVAVLSDDLAGANLTQDTVRVALLPELAHTRFVVWALLSRQTADYWDYQIMGATFRRLNLGTLARTPIPLPPLDEQRRIARYLDEQTTKIDSLIAATERFIDLSKERRAALITAAVTGQIDVQSEVA